MRKYWMIYLAVLVLFTAPGHAAELNAGDYAPHSLVTVSLDSIQAAGIIDLMETGNQCWHAQIKGRG
jgi:hypothetical protein